MINLIPPDVITRLQIQDDLVSAPTAPLDKLKDALSDLVPGQRVLAEIKALLPNGTYRATVAQRDVILSLPGSAKSGDTVELEVIENEGKIAFARIGESPPGTQTSTAQTSVSAHLSQTAQLIGHLLSEATGQEAQRSSVPLNGSAPLLPNPPTQGAELSPVLQSQLRQSGTFYESHLTLWASGELPTAELLKEPQGQLSSATLFSTVAEHPDHNPYQLPTTFSPLSASEALSPSAQPSGSVPHPLAQVAETDQQVLSTDTSTQHPQVPSSDHLVAPDHRLLSLQTQSDLASTERESSTLMANHNAPLHQTDGTHPESVAPSLRHLVQQQLESLATQQFSWQGQVWPGQTMEWQIEDRGTHADSHPEGNEYRWLTTVRLNLPQLGEVKATLQLRGQNEIDIRLNTHSADTELALSLGGPLLNQNLEAAGLYLTQFGVQHDE